MPNTDDLSSYSDEERERIELFLKLPYGKRASVLDLLGQSLFAGSLLGFIALGVAAVYVKSRPWLDPSLPWIVLAVMTYVGASLFWLRGTWHYIRVLETALLEVELQPNQASDAAPQPRLSSLQAKLRPRPGAGPRSSDR